MRASLLPFEVTLVKGQSRCDLTSSQVSLSSNVALLLTLKVELIRIWGSKVTGSHEKYAGKLNMLIMTISLKCLIGLK